MLSTCSAYVRRSYDIYHNLFEIIMKKALIIYSTRGGVSRECAEILRDKIIKSLEVSLFDIEDNPPAPNNFDIAVIGGSIRMAKLNKKLKKYLKQHAIALNEKHTALFLCCGFPESFDNYVAKQFPKNIIPSLGIYCFGGELKPKKLKGMDKLIVKMIRSEITGADFEVSDSSQPPLPEIVPENIYRLADKIRSVL